MSIGDLANDLARTLYEQRVAVAVMSITAFVGAVRVARRLGWLAAAGRHPRRTAVLGVLVLAVTLPTGWYLASPIFVRTSLVEAFPGAAPAGGGPSPSESAAPRSGATAAPATPVEPSISRATPTSAAARPTPGEPTPFEPRIVARGAWEGSDDFHFAHGTASIVEVGPGRHQLRLEDFSIRNGPDLYVYLSPSAEAWTEDALELGVLKATDGAFGYDIPPGVDPGTFRSAIVWCKAFSHLFATAPFEP